MNLGVRAHDFGRWSLPESARILGGTGLSCLQLALPKALTGFEPVAGNLTRNQAQTIRSAYADRGLQIAVLGCYINPVHPDPAALEQSLRRFEELLRFARDFGCTVVATETGSLNPDCSYHPETSSDRTFARLVVAFRRLAATAEAEGVRIGVEGVARNHTVSTPSRMTRLLAEVGSPSLGVLYDPANFLSPADADTGLEAAVDDVLERFGSRLVAVHAKDCRFEDGVKMGDLVAGTGQVPYGFLLPRLRALHPNLPILIEDVSPATWTSARDFLRRSAGAESGGS